MFCKNRYIDFVNTLFDCVVKDFLNETLTQFSAMSINLHRADFDTLGGGKRWFYVHNFAVFTLQVEKTVNRTIFILDYVSRFVRFACKPIFKLNIGCLQAF